MAASHGTRKMSDLEIEKVYGRGRKKHVAFDYATHLHVSTEYGVRNKSEKKLGSLTFEIISY